VVWNILDFAIVFTSMIDSWFVPVVELLKKELFPARRHPGRASTDLSLGQAMMLMRMMRLMRILRLVKVIKTVRPLYILVASVVSAIQGVFWVLVLTLVTFYGMGILATRIVGHGMLLSHDRDIDIMEGPFATVPDSMFTLLRVMSTAASEQESAAIDELVAKLPSVKFAFVFFTVTSSWMLLSILTAVVSETMISTTGQQEYELQIAYDELDRTRHLKELQQLFKQLDVYENGKLDERSLMNFLADAQHAQKCAKSCRVPVRYIRDVFRYLSVDGGHVDKNHFTTCLVDVGKPVTEKSVMKLEAHMAELHRKLDKVIEEKFAISHQEKLAHASLEKDELHDRILTKLQDNEAAMHERLRAHDLTTQGMIDRLNHLSTLVCDFSASFRSLTGISKNSIQLPEAKIRFDAQRRSCSHLKPDSEEQVQEAHHSLIGPPTDPKYSIKCDKSTQCCIGGNDINEPSCMSETLRSKLDFLVHEVSLALKQDYFTPAALRLSQQSNPSPRTTSFATKSHHPEECHFQSTIACTTVPRVSQVQSGETREQIASQPVSAWPVHTACTVRSQSLPRELNCQTESPPGCMSNSAR